MLIPIPTYAVPGGVSPTESREMKFHTGSCAVGLYDGGVLGTCPRRLGSGLRKEEKLVEKVGKVRNAGSKSST